MDKNIAVIILNWNGTKDTLECLESLKNQFCDIYILDNGSETENYNVLVSSLKNFPKKTVFINSEDFKNKPIENFDICLIRSTENLGFACGNNFVGYKIYKNYEYILLLNNDTVVPENFIVNLSTRAKEKNTDALTCDIRYYDDKNVLWNAGGKFKWYGDRKYFSQNKIDKSIKKGVSYIQADYITGCAMLIKSDYIHKNGILTDKFFHGEEDFNFCYKAKINKAIVGVDLSLKIFHKVGMSINPNKDADKAFKSTVVHYTNRIIDFKEFYGKTKWKLWRKFYIFLVLIKRFLSGMNLFNIILLKKSILFYTNRYDDVKKDVYDKILADEKIVLKK